MKKTNKSIRENILETAIGLTTGDRNKAYGDPYNNLLIQANMINNYLYARFPEKEIELTPQDIAMVYVLGKVTRIGLNPSHEDSHIDGAAYLAIAYECNQKED